MGKALFMKINPADMYRDGEKVMTLSKRKKIIEKARDGEILDRLAKKD